MKRNRRNRAIRQSSRLLAILLAAALVIGQTGIMSFADESDTELTTETITHVSAEDTSSETNSDDTTRQEDETDTYAQTESDSAVLSETLAGLGSDSVAVAESESEQKSDSESAAETELETETENIRGTEVEIALDSETESETEFESESETELETETESESETETEAETESESETEIESETESESVITTYRYEDNQVVVTAVLQYADAVPDDAEFSVTAVTSSTGSYNYDAYMQALNDNADTVFAAAGVTGDSESEESLFTEENTLLYDVAFLIDKTDKNGDVISGEKIEYQPASGSVSISFEFKKNQLTDQIDAGEDTLAIIHLPLDTTVKVSVDTTADATAISAGDVNVEAVDAESVSLESSTDQASFSLDDFSVVAFVGVDTENPMTAGTTRTYKDILGTAVYYGITANTIHQKAHMDTNFATKYYTSESGAYLTAGAYTGSNGSGVYVVADMLSSSEIKVSLTGIKSCAVWCTDDIKDQVTPQNIVSTYSKADLESYVDSMISYVKTVSTAMMKEDTYRYDTTTQLDMNNAEINITGLSDGTYYIEGDWIMSLQNGGLKIYKNSGQTIVFNFSSTTVKLNQFTVVNDGKQYYSSNSTSSIEPVAETIVFNMPNATTLYINSAICGVVLAPNAVLAADPAIGDSGSLGGTSSGWLVVDTMNNNKSEWHCVWSGMPASEDVPAPGTASISLTFSGTKSLTGKNLEAEEFSFTLYNENGDKIETVKNAADGSISFSAITYTAAGTYKYTVKEDAGSESGITYDGTVYTVTVTVGKDSGSGDLKVESTTYAADGVNATGITFTNKYSTDTSISGTKTLTGKTLEADEFSFTLYDENGDKIETVKNAADGSISFSAITYTAAGTYRYTVKEDAGSESGIMYDGTVYTVTVTVGTDNSSGKLNVESTTYAADGVAVSGITFTNYCAVSISGIKTWFDYDNKDNTRPESITVNLLANGEKIDSQTVTASADGTWSYEFTGLDKYDADNKLITYTIIEDAVTGYTTAINGYNVTNTLDTGSLTVTKTVAGSVVDTTIEFTFTVTLSDTTLNGTFGEMIFTDGVATFTLKHGESKTATDIPSGTTYTVTETSYTEDGYVTTSTGATGTIVTDATQTAAFTNTITSVKISKVDVTTEEELEGAHIELYDEDGNLVDEWDSTTEPYEVTGLKTGETYTLHETVAPTGYDVTSDTTFVLNEDGTIDTSKTTTTVSADGVLLVEDAMTKSETAEISVTKKLELSTGDTLIAPEATFYVGLYTDVACTNLYAMKTITFENASASTVTFTDLEIGRTYYIAECDSTGTALDSGIGAMADGTIFAADFGDGETTAAVAVSDGSQTTVTFTNGFYSMPGGFYKEGYLTITKKLLGADGAALKSDAVFYAGIYADDAYTTLATNVDQNIVTLDLAGGSEVSVTVAVSIAIGETVTLYVTEVELDENGNAVPVADAADFQYTTSQDTTEVTLDETNNSASVTITNKEVEETSEEESEEEESEEEETETESETESETEGKAVQTGDDTPLTLYMILLIGAFAVLIAAGSLRRKRN